MCVHRAEIDDGMLVVCVSPGGLLCVVFFRGPPKAVRGVVEIVTMNWEAWGVFLIVTRELHGSVSR